jgi:hypothetical protein
MTVSAHCKWCGRPIHFSAGGRYYHTGYGYWCYSNRIRHAPTPRIKPVEATT